MSSPLQAVTGLLLAIQEERFTLVADDGRVLLLTLSNRAPIRLSTLKRFHDANTRVRVFYSGEPNLVSGVAHSIQLERGQ